MKTYPPTPRLADAPASLLEGGHLWIQELVAGELLRFQVQPSGLVVFGDEARVYRSGESPPRFGHAVRHVRERLDRDALAAAVDDVTSVVFFAQATHRAGVPYDWAQTPSVLGLDVWSENRAAFLPPDATERVYDRLGLDPVNAFEKEVRAVDFDPGAYEIPQSAWYDGPAAGVVLRSKTGTRAILSNADLATDGRDATTAGDRSPADLAEAYVTQSRVRRVVDRLEERGGPVTVEAVVERVREGVAREHHDRLYGGSAGVDVTAFERAVGTVARRRLDALWDGRG